MVVVYGDHMKEIISEIIMISILVITLSGIFSYVFLREEYMNRMRITIISSNDKIYNFSLVIGSFMHNPTYEEMKTFIQIDNTDRNEYKEDFNCVQFSRYTKQNASTYGIMCHLVSIDFNCSWIYNIKHMIVCFNTTDRGIVFIEPQHDEEANISVGKLYHNCFKEKGYSNYDDYITKIQIF